MLLDPIVPKLAAVQMPEIVPSVLQTRLPITSLSRPGIGLFSAWPANAWIPEVLPSEILPPEIQDLDEAIAAYREGNSTLLLSEFAHRHIGTRLHRRQLKRLIRELYHYEELPYRKIFVGLDHAEWWLDERPEIKRTKIIRSKIKLFPSLDEALYILANQVEIGKPIPNHKGTKERILREEIEEVVYQKAARLFSDEDLIRGVTNYIRREARLKQSSGPSIEMELAAFADREKLLKKAMDAGLPPREFELFKLRVVETPRMTLPEAARHMGIAEGTAKSLWSRIKRTLSAV